MNEAKYQKPWAGNIKLSKGNIILIVTKKGPNGSSGEYISNVSVSVFPKRRSSHHHHLDVPYQTALPIKLNDI